ncbi:TonB-dependent receptor [Litchfieldella qijiaojingensis]|uniref:TonB-dependent receptor n=1 Tax=Litchfieldella qijiaojingensis TaxID=980347 RepID=A0ABQ2ZD65_9GAMM|nr:TonB-dependent receptor [Halomonas qijiaojingensis]GGY09451.1 TonB-dependent receptor [Halomonas qijiaojingensis]
MSHPRQPRITWLIPAVLSALPATALAQSTTEQESTNELSPLVVTATRNKSVAGETPQKITIITREQIEQQLAITSDRGQILSNLIPSYAPSHQKLTNSGETFRGRAPLFMIDGVPQSNPLRDTSRDSYTIDLSMVERIEVIHGASAEHGLGATGGIINYVTKRAEAGTVNQHAGVRLTSDDDFESEGIGYKLDYQINGQRGDWDYLVGATWQERGVFFDGADRPIGVETIQGEIQDSTSYDLFTKLGYWIDANQNIEFSANRFELEDHADYVLVEGDRDRGIPATARKGTPPGEIPFNESTTLSLSYAHADWLGNEFDAQLYSQRFRAQFGTHPFAFPFVDDEGNDRLDQTRAESDKLGAKFTLRRDGLLDDRLGLATGIDLLEDETRQMLVQTERTYVPETEFRNYAAFLQGDLEVLDSLTLHAGARYEYAELNVDDFSTIDRSTDVNNDLVSVDGGNPDFDEALFNAGVVYQTTDWLQFFANYSEGFGMPDVGRALRGISQPGQDVDTLLQLEPIVTENYEFGTRFGWNRLNFELSYYESNSDLGERLSEENGVFVGNREKTEIRGVDLSGELQVTDAHGLDFTYAYSEGESDTDGDGEVDTELSGANIPPETLTLGWDAQWSDKLTSRVQGRYFFDRTFDEQDNENLKRFDGYTLVDASLAYQLPVGQANLGIENLLDEDYITYRSQVGRDGDDRFFAGRGRTLTLGYQLDF